MFEWLYLKLTGDQIGYQKLLNFDPENFENHLRAKFVFISSVITSTLLMLLAGAFLVESATSLLLGMVISVGVVIAVYFLNSFTMLLMIKFMKTKDAS